MHYGTMWRNRFLTAKARTIEEMAQALEDAAGLLRQMGQAGVILAPDSGVEDDHALLVTADPRVARMFDLEAAVAGDIEEDGDPEVWGSETPPA